MSHTTLHTAYFFRGDIVPCSVEVEVTTGIGIHVIGIPDAACKEMLLRVATAIEAQGYHLPGQKIVISIQPHGGQEMWAGAFRPRECCEAFDLAVALGILIAAGQIDRPVWKTSVDDVLFFARLSLDGCLAVPATGIDFPSAIRVLDWQLRRNWDALIAYDTHVPEEQHSIYKPMTTLLGVAEALKEGRF